MEAIPLEEQFELARQARDVRDEKQAAAWYRSILRQEPENWEASFFTGYYNARKVRFTDTEAAVKELGGAFEKSLGDMCSAFSGDGAGARLAFRTLMRYADYFTDSLSAACVSGYQQPVGDDPGSEKEAWLKSLKLALEFNLRVTAALESLQGAALELLGGDDVWNDHLLDLYAKTVEIATKYSNFVNEGRSAFWIRRHDNGLLKKIEENADLIRAEDPHYRAPYCRARAAFAPEEKRQTALYISIAAAFLLCIAAVVFFIFMRQPLR